ncbi:hypothetical protein [Vibrio sp. MA40-2]|uniref:hypothetical protein n=1 Tax=Vibrio sp. MA40-2 TaxID=3391828 RepID=UPI0039A75ACA
MINIPSCLQDAQTLLTPDGFEIRDIWYHGTSSTLLPSIKKQGLKRSGDKALNQAAKNTMSTIGNNFTPVVEPVFLTQSKELAYYWAEQAARSRSSRLGTNEEPIVLAVNLPENQRNQIKPDVGATSLLLIKTGEQFMAHLGSIYERCGYACPDIDLIKADRMAFLNKLGMAYLDQDIHATCVNSATE